MKCFCPTINGLRVWNELQIKQSSDINQFKYKYKRKVFGRYNKDEHNNF